MNAATQEHGRLRVARDQGLPRRRWGPYLSERHQVDGMHLTPSAVVLAVALAGASAPGPSVAAPAAGAPGAATRAIPRRRQPELRDVPDLAPAPVLPVDQLRSRRPDSR
jgi:hypothetical protein